MKFNAVLTKEQAKEMFAYLEDIFTEVKVLDIEAVRRLEKIKFYFIKGIQGTVPEKKTGIR